jgi:ATP-dependent helicase IRC3
VALPEHLQEALAIRAATADPTVSSSITLRPYQDEAIASVRGLAADGERRTMVVMATGTGKTVVFAELARRIAYDAHHAARVLVIAHRDELIDQAKDKLHTVWPGASVGIVKAEKNQASAEVVVASIQTLHRERRRKHYLQYGRPDLIVVDEAHHAGARSYMETLAALGAFSQDGPLVVGFTATPSAKDRDLAAAFPKVAYSYPMDQAVEDGYLVDVVGVQVELEGLDLSDVKRSQGDYKAAELGEALDKADAPDAVVQAYLEHAQGRRAICFTPLVSLAHKTAELAREAGLRAVAISGDTAKPERQAVYRQLRNGELDIVANSMLLTEGFDEPTVDCVIVARPTQSRGLYVQMVGRGTRLAPGKDDCLVIDLMGASRRHSLVTLGDLIGLPAGRLTGRVSMREERERLRGEAIAAEKDAQTKMELQLRHRKVQLLAKMVWVPVPNGFAMSLPDGNLLSIMQVDPGDDESWRVGVIRREGMNLRLADGISMEYAQGVAEDYARHQGAGKLQDKAAGWRKVPPSRGALGRARALGVAIPAGATAGTVSDLITAAEVTRAVEEHQRRWAA